MDPTHKALVIIFYRNPRLGFVKTRLAATLGDRKALDIFKNLALHTRNVTAGLPVDKIVFYSDSIETNDIWIPTHYAKAVQKGADLGDKMRNAFAYGFEKGYEAICIIGTDCYEITGDIVMEAFRHLDNSDAVIGPARDGGYYLLGMRELFQELFRQKQWSTDTVLQATLRDFSSLELRYAKLQTLRDVDTEADLPEEWRNTSWNN